MIRMTTFNAEAFLALHEAAQKMLTAAQAAAMNPEESKKLAKNWEALYAMETEMGEKL